MEPLLDDFRSLGTAWLGTFWLPTLAWTLMALLGLGILRRRQTTHPFLVYTIHLTLLLALPLGLLLAQVIELTPLPALMPEITTTAPTAEAPPVPLIAGPKQAAGPATSFIVEVGFPMVGFLTLLAGCATMIALGISIRHHFHFRQWRRSLAEIPVPAELEDLVRYEARKAGIRRPIRIICTTADIPPLTFGTWYPRLVVPSTLVDQSDLTRVVVQHEMIHIRRFDDLLHRFGLLIEYVFVFNPVVRHIHRTAAFFRELSCDATVLAQSNVSLRTYAGMLYRLSGNERCPASPVLQMSTSQPELTRRIMAMKHFPTTPLSVRSTFFRGFLLLAVLTLIVSCSKTVDPQVDTEVVKDDEVYVIVEEMPAFPGGVEALEQYMRQELRYPVIAQKAGVEGRVLVSFIVGKDGLLSEVEVKRGIGAGCDEEALRLVKAMPKWMPGKQRGKAVPVRFSLPIAFKIGGTPGVALEEGVKVEGKRMGIKEIRQGDHTISGRVVDLETGRNLVGASVVIEGTTVGATSGSDGRFTVNLDKTPEAEALVVSYVGYEFLKIQMPEPAPPQPPRS